METVWIVVIAFFAYWLIGLVVYYLSRENDTFAALWSMGLVFIILYSLCYPVRAMRTYSNSKGYYQRNGVSRLQYFFGKRVRRDKEV